MNNYKLIMSDMDGTLLNSKNTISPFNKRIIGKIYQELHIPFVLTSGRSIQSLKLFQKKLNITGPIVSFGGTFITDGEKELYSKSIEIETTSAIINFLKTQDIETFIFAEDGWYLNEMNSWYDYEISLALVKGIAKPFNQALDYFKSNNIKTFKLLCLEKNEVKITKIKELLIQKFSDVVDVYQSDINNIEIMPKNIDKGASIDILCKYYNISPNEVIAFGDYLNDLNMMKKAGCSVAPSNALDIVKESSNIIGPSNDENCVGKVLERLLNLKNK